MGGYPDERLKAPKRMPAFVVAHFDPSGRVGNHLVQLVRSLPGPVVFVSTGISDSEARRVGAFAKVVARPNVGYDFFSYRTGIEMFQDSLGELDGLVILNSSFITVDPERLLRGYFSRFGAETHLLGLTRSDHIEPHLQSFWVGFGPPVLRSPSFLEWWRGVEPISDRREVIRRYELGMSRFFLGKGFSIDAVFEPDTRQRLRGTMRAIDCPIIKLASGVVLSAALADEVNPDGWVAVNVNQYLRELNPTHLLWDFLLESLGIVKVDLLRSNPLQLNLLGLKKLCTPAQWDLVMEALDAKTGGGAAPAERR
jgi:hypothetical protein